MAFDWFPELFHRRGPAVSGSLGRRVDGGCGGDLMDRGAVGRLRVVSSVMAPGRYTAPGFFWKPHACFPGCREASGAGAIVVRAAGRRDDGVVGAARCSAAAVDTI